jgi:hypothetical protein
MALDLASAVTTHLDAVARRPGRRARRSVGQHTVGDWRPSYLWRLSPFWEWDRHRRIRRSQSPISARLSRMATARFRDEPS